MIVDVCASLAFICDYIAGRSFRCSAALSSADGRQFGNYLRQWIYCSSDPSVTGKCQDIVRAVCLQTTLLNVKAELDQMAEGLKLFNVISLLRQHPQKIDVDSVLTLDQMVALFDVEYSP